MPYKLSLIPRPFPPPVFDHFHRPQERERFCKNDATPYHGHMKQARGLTAQASQAMQAMHGLTQV